MSLPTGNYFIVNDGDGPVGIQSPVPPVQPIVHVINEEIWFVKHIGADHYLLDISGYVTVAETNHVVGNRFPGVQGTVWIIKLYQPGRYTIIGPQPGHKGWTLNPGILDVLLEPVPLTDVKPPQLWLFRRVLSREEEEEEEEGEGEGEEEEEKEDN
ncbi:hypothetical protein BC827DRAFT_1272134 [Russula dissimulans]|nr:hypothetical protein BC827DRAFT_1272134 [Russula dissimulans]